MTASTLKKYRTINYDTNGRPESVTLNLKNRDFRKFYEVLMEDYLDIMAIKKAKKEDDETRYTLVKKGEEFVFEEIMK